MATSDRTPRTKKKRRFPISLAMIVRNEEAVLGRCLDSVLGLVDEIVVVDTGSTDRTVEIAEQYGASVHHFAWVDDFSAARNFSLEKTTHPWRLVLDADEWIVDRAATGAVLDRIGESVPTFAGAIDMLQVDKDDKDGPLNDGVEPISLIRLLPRQLGFTGRVHEQPTPEIRTLRIGVLLGHDGYTTEASARKEGRNVALLVAALEEDPTDAYLWYQLGSEFLTRNQADEALPYLVQAYNLLHPEEAGAGAPERAAWWHRVTLRLMLALNGLERFAESTALGEVEAAAWPDSPDFFYVFGCSVRGLALSVRATDRVRAEDLMVSSLGLWVQAVELEDQQQYAGILATRGTVLAARLVAKDYDTLGRHAEADRYRAIARGAGTAAPTAVGV